MNYISFYHEAEDMNGIADAQCDNLKYDLKTPITVKVILLRSEAEIIVNGRRVFLCPRDEKKNDLAAYIKVVGMSAEISNVQLNQLTEKK